MENIINDKEIRPVNEEMTMESREMKRYPKEMQVKDAEILLPGEAALPGNITRGITCALSSGNACLWIRRYGTRSSFQFLKEAHPPSSACRSTLFEVSDSAGRSLPLGRTPKLLAITAGVLMIENQSNHHNL